MATFTALSLCAAAAAASSPVEDSLRRYFEGLDAGAEPVAAGKRLRYPSLVSQTYRSRDHQPLWTAEGPLSGQTDTLLAAVEASTAHGLNAADYHAIALRLALDRAAGDLLAAELLATDAFLGQVRHRSSGAVSPRDLDPDWHLIEPEVDAVSLLQAVARDGSEIGLLLDGLWPRSTEYQDLLDQRARILAMGEVEVVKVPSGPLLKPGQSNERVTALKDRLLGPGDHTPAFDAELRATVMAFQRAAGLEPDGIVGDATLEVMNASRFSWIDRLDANLERWRWLPQDVPETYVRVNIAAFSLRVIQRGEDALRMDVIVGRPYRRTPVFAESIRYMVFNPYWNVPYKLAVQDKLPALKRDAAELEAQGFEVRPDGESEFVPVTAVDWGGVERRSFRHLLRQRPGPHNALGQVKFMLPNAHAVYLHDTPSKDLFSRQERGFSSGCVRLSRPLELADWILRNDGRAEEAQRIEAMLAAASPATVYLKTPLPTYLVYFTAFTDADGEVVFRRDLYQRDAPLVAALREGTGS